MQIRVRRVHREIEREREYEKKSEGERQRRERGTENREGVRVEWPVCGVWGNGELTRDGRREE